MRWLSSQIYRVYIALRSRVYVIYHSWVHGVQFGRGVRIYSKLLVHGPGKVIIADGTHITSRRAVNELYTTKPDAVLTVGKNCSLNGAIVACAKSITIGDRCVIAEAYIRDTSSHGLSPGKRHNADAAKIDPVVLDENVWIGSHTHVMPGVTIGRNTIVGVNSVVTKSLPENVFAGGIPAKIIYALDDDNQCCKT